MTSHVSDIIKILKRKTRKTMLGQFERKSPFYILISTILSARNRDEMTIIAARKLFSKYRTPNQIANAPVGELRSLLRQSGFYKTKATRVKQACKYLLEHHNGQVPKTMEELVRIPGVGRKTAGCVLVYAFGGNAIPVDTHVHRISNRLGWIKTRNPAQTEKDLAKIVPLEHWKDVNEVLVVHGQTICHPTSPKCSLCQVSDYCRKVGVVRSR